MSNSDTKNQPVQEIRLGLIKAVIWANPTKNNGTMHNVTLARLYRDSDDKWQESASFRRDDLLLTRKVLDAAHSWICQTEQERSANESEAASA